MFDRLHFFCVFTMYMEEPIWGVRANNLQTWIFAGTLMSNMKQERERIEKKREDILSDPYTLWNQHSFVELRNLTNYNRK